MTTTDLEPCYYRDTATPCTLALDHPGPCRTWIEDAELEDEPRLWREPDEVEPQGMTR